MKIMMLLLGLIVSPLVARAGSTINSNNAYAWGANIGWTNWLADSPADGVVVGEFTCSGYVYGANVGWINFGNGSPVNHIQYQNNSTTDFGVNYSVDPNQPGVGILRGFAYGANIGWINFEATGNPRVSLLFPHDEMLRLYRRLGPFEKKHPSARQIDAIAEEIVTRIPAFQVSKQAR